MKTSPFQVGIIIFFVVFFVVAMLIFTGVIGKKDAGPGQAVGGQVVLWGTYSDEVMAKLISEYNAAHQKEAYSITYVPIAPTDLDTKLAEAIASGNGPDLVMLNQDQILKNQAKLTLIPYEQLPEATVRGTWATESELFMLSGGTIGLPLTIDPLIMYYNRDLFEGAGLTLPPKTWNEVAQITPRLTRKDANTNITQSAIPFGIYSNLNHARDILALLLFQAGNPIISKQGDKFIPVLSGSSGQLTATSALPPAQAVVNFFTQFVDPTKETYTWNRSFRNARDQFINGELAIYFGYASELPLIVAQNPNLNFDVTKVPQSGGSGAQITFGRMQALALVKASKNPQTAFQIMMDLTSADFVKKLLDSFLQVAPLAPARRDMLTGAPQTLFGPTLYSSAVIAHGWYDPGAELTDPIFNDMVDNVVRGATTTAQAVGDAQSRLTVIFGR